MRAQYCPKTILSINEDIWCLLYLNLLIYRIPDGFVDYRDLATFTNSWLADVNDPNTW